MSQQHPHPPTDSDPPSQNTYNDPEAQELDDQDRAFLARLQHEPDPTDEIPF